MDIRLFMLAWMRFLTNLKLFHFQTTYYGAHKASDALGASSALLFDKFMEVYQGQHGRVGTTAGSIGVESVYDDGIVGLTHEFIGTLHNMRADLSGAADLLNILDEASADASQFLYLLHFK